MKLTNSYIVLILLASILTIPFTFGQVSNGILEDKYTVNMDSVIDYFQQHAWDINATNPALAQRYLDSASSFTNKNNQTSSLAKILEIKGALHLANSNFKEASLDYKKSINLYNQTTDLQYRSGYVQIELGTILFKLGQYEEALKFYQPAIKLFDSADQSNEAFGKSLAYNNIGLCQMYLNDYTSALSSFRNALDYRLPLLQPDLIAHSYSYFGTLYINAGQYQEADSVINKGLSISGLLPSNIWYKKLQLKKSQLRILENNLTAARPILDDLNLSVYNNSEAALKDELNHNLCKLEISSQNYSQAKIYAERGYTEALALKNHKEALEFANISKEIALKQNNFQEALRYAERISLLKDTFITQSSAVLKDLLTMSGQMVQAEQENSELQNTTNAYSSTIEDQKGLLVASVILILLLALVAYIVTRLNAKLNANQRNQRELNLRILAVINRTESLIISLGPDGVIRVINKPATKFFKKWINVELTAGDILEEKLAGTKALSSWQQSLKKSRTVPHWKEISQFSVNNQRLYFLENFSSITHRDGTYAGLVVVSNDITKEHEYNVKMSEQNSSLEESNKAKERMLSILAHDLKDAVYSAHSLSELVLETPDEFPKEELLHLFSLLHGNFDKTKSLLDGLLDWIKTQTGGLEIKLVPFNLKQLVAEVFEACYEKSVSKKIKLSMNIPEDLVVSGDREMIKTVLRNLVNNSIKYVQPETGLVEVASHINGNTASICVKDNGQGMSKENQKKLFQGPGRFTTEGTAKEQGTGFGLSLCKELVGLHKSELCLKSKVGEGSEFFFNLSLAHKNDLSKKQLH